MSTDVKAVQSALPTVVFEKLTRWTLWKKGTQIIKCLSLNYLFCLTQFTCYHHNNLGCAILGKVAFTCYNMYHSLYMQFDPKISNEVDSSGMWHCCKESIDFLKLSHISVLPVCWSPCYFHLTSSTTTNFGYAILGVRFPECVTVQSAF